MRRVRIQGGGIAACCCEHLLKRAGFEVWSEPVERPRLPAIMLSETALALIREVFERPNLFPSAHHIRERAVAWRRGEAPVSVPHSAVVVSEEELLNALRVETSAPAPSGKPDWTVVTSRPLPAGAVEHPFGTRMAHASLVTLRTSADACWIESLDDGWLFLIPNSASAGWLLAVGSTTEKLLARSRVVAEKVGDVQPASGEFAAFPRMAEPLCETGWIAVGTAAMAFDPLCGDGTANAVREAILAAAVIGAMANGVDAKDLARHYEARLTAGFQRHLALCLSFYLTGGTGAWWRNEAAALQEGLRWCVQKNGSFGSYQFQLRGFELVRV